MPKRTDITEDDVLAAIQQIRAEEGVCTYPALGDAIGLTKTAARYRVKKLAERGLVEVTPGEYGAIRVVGEEPERPPQTVDVRLYFNHAGQVTRASVI